MFVKAIPTVKKTDNEFLLLLRGREAGISKINVTTSDRAIPAVGLKTALRQEWFSFGKKVVLVISFGGWLVVPALFN